MLGKLAHEICLMTVVGAANRHIGLAATPDHIKRIYLHKSVTACRRKSEHYFSESYYLAHFFQ